MNDKEIVENIVLSIAESFSGKDSTANWSDETVWFDAAPYACIGRENAIGVFDEAFGNLKSCDVEVLEMITRVNGDSALVCSSQRWNTVSNSGEALSLMMRQSDYFEKINGEWKVLHEHTSLADGWNGEIIK